MLPLRAGRGQGSGQGWGPAAASAPSPPPLAASRTWPLGSADFSECRVKFCLFPGKKKKKMKLFTRSSVNYANSVRIYFLYSASRAQSPQAVRKALGATGDEEGCLTAEGPSGPATPMLLSGISCWPCVRGGSPVEVNAWTVSLRVGLFSALTAAPAALATGLQVSMPDGGCKGEGEHARCGCKGEGAWRTPDPWSSWRACPPSPRRHGSSVIAFLCFSTKEPFCPWPGPPMPQSSPGHIAQAEQGSVGSAALAARA